MEMTNLNLSFCVLVFGRSWTKFPGSQELQLKSSEDVRQVTVGVKTNTNKIKQNTQTRHRQPNKTKTKQAPKNNNRKLDYPVAVRTIGEKKAHTPAQILYI